MSILPDIFLTNGYTFWISGILGILTLLYIYGTWNYNFFKKLGMPGPKPFPFFGHFNALFREGLINFDAGLIKKYGNYVGVYMGRYPNLLCNDVDVAKQVMVKEATNFMDRSRFSRDDYPMRRSITQLCGEDWKRVRSLLTPTFTSGKMKKMTPLMTDAVEHLQNRFVKSAEAKEDVDVNMYYGGLTMDIIARTMFGLDINSQADPENIFVTKAAEMSTFNPKNPLMLLIIAVPQLAGIISRLSISLFPGMGFFVKTVHTALEERKKLTGQQYHDFLALMVKAHEEHVASEAARTSATEETRGLTEEEIIAQAVVFMLAGHATTAGTLQFLSYHLAMNPEIQQKCLDEIQREIGDEELNYDTASRLQYVEQCILETLRLCPPAVRLDRVCTNPTTLLMDGRAVDIPKGLTISFPTFVMHRNPDVWEYPETFNPERFTQEERERRNPFYFMPFGMGPRNCIGMRFAMLEIKLAIASVLRRVKFVPCEKTLNPLTFSKKASLLAPESAIILRTELLDAAQEGDH